MQAFLNTEKSGAKVAPLWNFLEKPDYFVNGTTWQSGTKHAKTSSKREPSCGHKNGSTVEPFRLPFFLSVKL